MVGNIKGQLRNTRKPMAGMIDKAADFFMVNGELYCSHDFQVYIWPDFPDHLIDIVRDDMEKNPQALKALSQWENLLPDDYVYQYIVCRFGGIDDEPDINIDGQVHHTEYVDCVLRGSCKYEGRLCCALKAEFGIISPAEMAVLRLSDKLIKVIADKLCITEETVKSHLKSIKDKTGLKDKLEVAVYAMKKGLINE